MTLPRGRFGICRSGNSRTPLCRNVFFSYFYWIIWTWFHCVAEKMHCDSFVQDMRNTHGSRVESRAYFFKNRIKDRVDGVTFSMVHARLS